MRRILDRRRTLRGLTEKAPRHCAELNGLPRGSTVRLSAPAPAAWRYSPQSGQDDDIHFPTGMGAVMSKFERLLVAGSTELPDCRCATEMHLTAIVPVPGGDTEIRIFRCPDCSHELRLTAWRNGVSAT